MNFKNESNSDLFSKIRVQYAKQFGKQALFFLYYFFLNQNHYFLTLLKAKIIAIDSGCFKDTDFAYLCYAFEEYFKIICSVKDVDKRIPLLTILVFDSNKLVRICISTRSYRMRMRAFSILTFCKRKLLKIQRNLKLFEKKLYFVLGTRTRTRTL